MQPLSVFSSSRKASLFVLFLVAGLYLPIPAETSLRLQATLSDSDFSGSDTIIAQVLESGDTLTIRHGEQFTMPLPLDTAWHLCFTATELEKCYTLQHSGQNSLIEREFANEGITLRQGSTGEKPPDLNEMEDPKISETSESVAAPSESLAEEVVRLRKVVVRAQRRPKRSLGKATVSAKLMKRLPGLAEADVIRTIQGLPGVVASSDFSTKIYVRGGGADQNLILLDNAPVYSPVHFFGLFSTFLVEAVDEVDFYKGGFPAEYGNRLSSVLDIKSRLGGKDTADTWMKGSSLKISTFATQVHTEGKQGDARWLLAGRTTYIKQILDFLESIGVTDFTVDYNFFDLQGNLRYDLGAGSHLTLSGYHGKDRLNFFPILLDWGNTVIPLNYVTELSEKSTAQTTLSFSHFSQSFGVTNLFQFYNKITNATFRQSVEYRGLNHHRLKAGVELNRFETVFSNQQDVVDIKLVDKETYWQHTLFAQDTYTLGPADITGGLRSTYISTLPEYVGLEPRLSLKYRLPHQQAIEASAGYYLQYINSILWVDQETLNEFYYPAKKGTYNTLYPSNSWLFSLGYNREKWLNQFDFILEGYYKALSRLLVFDPLVIPEDANENLADLPLVDYFKDSEGYSYGAEVSLRRVEGLIFGGASYSRGFSVMKDRGDAGAYYPKWHQPHSVKADLAVNIRGPEALFSSSQNFFWRTSTQLSYSTGLPFTEVIGYTPAHLQDQGHGIPAGGPTSGFSGNQTVLRGHRNGARVPPYFRWDVKVIDVGRENKWNFSWTILNITDNENIFLYSYDRANPPKRTDITQFPFFPILINYEYYF